LILGDENLKFNVWDKDAKKLITSNDPEAKLIRITLDGKIFWDDRDMSKDLELKFQHEK